MLLIYLAPVFILFEMLQLVVAERFIGVKQIRTGIHPLESGVTASEWVAGCWLIGMLANWLYLLALIFNPWGGLQGFIMLFVSLIGIGLRRSLGLKWTLFIMTLEGAVRMGLLANLMINALFFSGGLNRWTH